MPHFDLRYIRAAKYVYDKSTKKVTYGTIVAVGEAMSANLELKFSEGRLYSEGRLSEYMKAAIGGAISLAVKSIETEAQKLFYGASESTRSLNTKNILGLKFTAKDEPSYVGVSFFAPDRINGAPKYTCMFVPKTLFGPPSYAYQTKGEKLTFQTPTTTGEFMADDTVDELLIDTAVVDTIEEAMAWCDAVLASPATTDEGNLPDSEDPDGGGTE